LPGPPPPLETLRLRRHSRHQLGPPTPLLKLLRLHRPLPPPRLGTLPPPPLGTLGPLRLRRPLPPPLLELAAVAVGCWAVGPRLLVAVP